MKLSQSHSQLDGGVASIRASQAGLQYVDNIRRRKGWAKQSTAWADLASTSATTLKRFWGQKRIRADSFINICSVVGIEDWQSIADWSQ